MFYLALATEDSVSEAIGLRLVREYASSSEVCLRLGCRGNGYLRSKLSALCEMSRQYPVFLLTDLDRGACASALVEEWMNGSQKPTALVFRVAVREVESWLLADHEGLRGIFGKRGRFPLNPDELDDPKTTLLNLAKKAPRKIRDDLLAESGSIATQGMGYNARLVQFIAQTWSPARARQRSDSLSRACKALQFLSDSMKG